MNVQHKIINFKKFKKFKKNSKFKKLQKEDQFLTNDQFININMFQTSHIALLGFYNIQELRFSKKSTTIGKISRQWRELI